MLSLARLLFGLIFSLFASRSHLLLENLALRQQLTAFRRHTKRPHITQLDRLFWVTLRCDWSNWKDSLVIVTPNTVVGWHRAGFRLYWKWISKRKALGRKPIAKELREIILQIAVENPTWGAPRIHGELLKLGFDVSERTVSRLLQRAPRNPDAISRWKAFLKNHREAIAAMDFFTVPTLTFGVLHCFFVIAHERRRVLHLNVTRYPTQLWVCQQLRDAFPFNVPYKYLIFDRDSKFGEEVCEAVEGFGLRPVRTSYRSPWQNGVAERWVGSCRRELLDHVIPLNESHLKRLVCEYVAYYHLDRTHLALGKDTPFERPTMNASDDWRIVSQPRVGGLHHRYDRAA